MEEFKGKLKYLISTAHKAAQRQSFKNFTFASALLLFSFNPASAEKNRLKAIYFNSENSIVIEAETELEINRIDGTSIAISNSKLSGEVPELIDGQNFDIEVSKTKSEDKAFWSFNDQILLKIKSQNYQNYQITTRPILENLVYEISFEPTASSEKQTPEILELSAKINEDDEHQLRRDKLKQFVDKLDSKLADDLLTDPNFQTLSKEKQDSTALVHLADNLVEHGEIDNALSAYREALELNPENHNAQLGLAKISPDEEESLRNYLSSIDDQALLSVSETWFQQGQESHDMKSIAKGLVAYQFAILKNPQEANYRFKYAQALEHSGPNFYQQSAQRYLEAAALAKQQYLAGIEASENLLRDATEALILLQVKLGDFITANKFCNSYLNLGFKKFQNGKSILALMKELEANRNPFRKELAMLGGYHFD